jgi:hypothetical protein
VDGVRGFESVAGAEQAGADVDFAGCGDQFKGTTVFNEAAVEKGDATLFDPIW